MGSASIAKRDMWHKGSESLAKRDKWRAKPYKPSPTQSTIIIDSCANSSNMQGSVKFGRVGTRAYRPNSLSNGQSDSSIGYNGLHASLYIIMQ